MLEFKMLNGNCAKLVMSGDTHTIYKELMHVVCNILQHMHLENDSGEIPLSDSVTEFGQRLIMLSQKHKDEFDLLGKLGSR